MPIPDYQSFMRPLLVQLADGNVHALSKVRERLIEEFSLTHEEVKEKISSGKQTVFNNRLGWAKTYMAKAGLLTTPQKAQYQISELGQKALKDCPDYIDNEYLKQYPDFVEFISPKKTEQVQGASATPATTSETTPEELLDSAHKAITKSTVDELLNMIKSASATFFEQLVVDLMLAMGYGGPVDEAGMVTSYGGDDGIDGVIKEDRLGLDVIYLQAKKWEKTIHRPEIDKFIGSLTRHSANKGVFITTSDFSSGCLEAVKHMNMKVVLIDGTTLAELMIEHNLGVTTKEVYEVKQIDSDYFSEDS